MCHCWTFRVIMPCCSLMWFTDFLYRLYSWVGLLVACLLWKLIWCPLVPWKLLLMEESFRLVPAQGPLCSASEVQDIFNNRDLPLTSGWCVTKGNSNRLYVLGASWTALTNNSKGFLCLVLGTFVRWSLAEHCQPGEKISFKLYVFICTWTCVL